jgi:uncharacterized protein (TIGR02996 family)
MSALEDQLDRDPHDETAFLVYADALLERGNPHGELIRVQHALTRNPGDAALKARDLELRAQVLPELTVLGDMRWSLGFPRSASLFWVGDENFGSLSTVLRSRLCRFIESVTLSDYVTGERVVDLLATLPHLEEVTLSNNLEVISNRSALRLLAAIGRLRDLERLHVQTRSATVLLTEMPSFPKLQRLTLSGTRLAPEDAVPLGLVRSGCAPGCVLMLEKSTASFIAEERVFATWPYETDDLHRPGLLVEAPAEHRGCWLLSTGADLRIGHHLACDLSLAGNGLRAVHSVFDGQSIRDAGDLTTAPRTLKPGERVVLGDAVLRFCDDVLVARTALREASRTD